VAIREDRALPTGPNKWTALVVVCLIVFVICINTTAINTAVATIADDLTLSTSTLGWAIDVYMLAAAALVVLGGQVGDILGRRWVTLVGIGVFAVGSVLVATSFSGAQLIGGRALQGAGGAVLMPATMAIINDTFSKEESGTALGVWGAISMLAFAFGPLYGGFLTEALSWRVIFWADVALLLVAAALLFALLRGLPGGRSGVKVDIPGAVLLALGSFLVVLALQQGQHWGWGSGLFLVVLAVGLLLSGAFVMVELYRRNPLVNFSLFRRRQYVAGILATFTNTVGLMGLLYFFNLYVQSAVLFDYSPLHASVVLLPYTVSMFVFAYPSGRIADRIGYRIPVVAGLLIMTGGFVLLSRVSVGTTDAELWLPIVLCGVGVGLTYSTTSAAGLSAVPAEEAGQGAGVINMARFLGAVFIIAVGTILYVGQGVETLDEQLARAGAGQVEETKLDRVLTGSPSALDRTAKELDPEIRDAFVSGARQGIVDGFTDVMWLIAFVGLAGTLLSFWLLRPDRRSASRS
jgi:MFS transporter, DHA2 family, methylenomycin A resistance protein